MMEKQELVSGYFDADGNLHLVGKFGAEMVIEPGGSVVPPPSNGGSNGGGNEAYVETTLTWKRQGANPATNPAHKHPAIGDGEFVATYIRHGEMITLDFTITIGSNTELGVGPDGKGWYFTPDDESIKPDFTDPKTLQTPGILSIWINDNHIDRTGACKWSKNVGSGIDGILFNLDQLIYPISEDYPRVWPTGTKFRAQISYRAAIP
jgi:hypothetical protein